VEDWAEIRRLRKSEGMPIKVIARVVGCSKNTVKAALAAEGPPRYERVRRGSVVDGVEPRIRELLAAWPTMPATVVAERIGWSSSIRTLSGRVAELSTCLKMIISACWTRVSVRVEVRAG
jgi:transposase